MSLVLKLIASIALLPLVLAAGALADFTLNEGRVLYALMGRDKLVEACLPELKKGLADRGFAPADLELDPRPSISIALGRPKTFGADFTFQDGAAAMRVDGVLACVVGKNDVHVDFRTSARPVRAG